MNEALKELAVDPDLAERDRPREQERHFEIEDNEQNGHKVIADIEFVPRIIECVETAFIGGQFLRIRLLLSHVQGQTNGSGSHNGVNTDEDQDRKIIE